MLLPKGARLQDDESIIFPRRGRPPVVDPAIWEMVGNDPFQYQLSLFPCQERTIIEVELPCKCGVVPRPFCKAVEHIVCRKICYNCKASPEWIKEKFNA